MLCRKPKNGSFEPKVPDAASCANVRLSGLGQKRDKTKRSFAKGLWHKFSQRFQRWQCM
jgi:hypothetical protein